MTTAMPELARPVDRGPRIGSILLLVFGTLVALAAMGLLAAGGFVTWADHTQRDGAGYFTTSTERFATGTYALTQEDVDLRDFPSWLRPGDLGTIRISAASADGKPIFVGIARERDVDRWLRGVAHAEVTDVDWDPFSAEYASRPGGAPGSKPAAARFWAASAAGAGRRTVTWDADRGKWAAVVMNANGSRGVAANVKLGAKVTFLGWLEGGLFAGGLLLLAGGAALLYFGGRGFDGADGRRATPQENAA